MGQWPWPRSAVADLLKTIQRAGGVAVGFDIIFPVADRLSPDCFGRSISNLSIEAAKELDALANIDQVLADTMKAMRVVLGQAASVKIAQEDRAPQKQTPVALLGGDPKSYDARIRAFLQAPPPPDWDGVYVAQTK